MTIDQKINLTALYVVAREEGLPIPTDLTTQLVNHGVRKEHLQQAAKMSDRIAFVRACLTLSEEELDEIDMSEDTIRFIRSVRELLTPDMKDALEEQKETDGS